MRSLAHALGSRSVVPAVVHRRVDYLTTMSEPSPERDVPVSSADVVESSPGLTRRDLLRVAGLTGAAALVGSAAGASPQPAPGRPRVACLASYWAAPNSHAD